MKGEQLAAEWRQELSNKQRMKCPGPLPKRPAKAKKAAAVAVFAGDFGQENNHQGYQRDQSTTAGNRVAAPMASAIQLARPELPNIQPWRGHRRTAAIHPKAIFSSASAKSSRNLRCGCSTESGTSGQRKRQWRIPVSLSRAPRFRRQQRRNIQPLAVSTNTKLPPVFHRAKRSQGPRAPRRIIAAVISAPITKNRLGPATNNTSNSITTANRQPQQHPLLKAHFNTLVSKQSKPPTRRGRRNQSR